jgi:hypothetical protein
MSDPLPHKNMILTTQWLYSKGGKHAGFDYSVKIGTPLFAVRAGKILRVVDHIDNLPPDVDGAPLTDPNFIMLGITYKGEPVTVLYLHVSPNVPVKVGDRVEDGQLIGKSGHNGHSEGPHLHISVMKGHNHVNPFDYLNGIQDNSKAPHGVASNGITIFPPSLVYSPGPWARGKVRLASLVPGNTDSKSVRRLQFRLNEISLEGGAELDVTGNYNKATRAEVQKWQVQRLNANPELPKGDGVLDRAQAKVFFKSPRYTLVL